MGRILSCIVKDKKFAATTEYSSASAWSLYFGGGYLNYWSDKVGGRFHVRPVSALNKEDKLYDKIENDRF